MNSGMQGNGRIDYTTYTTFVDLYFRDYFPSGTLTEVKPFLQTKSGFTEFVDFTSSELNSTKVYMLSDSVCDIIALCGKRFAPSVTFYS